VLAVLGGGEAEVHGGDVAGEDPRVVQGGGEVLRRLDVLLLREQGDGAVPRQRLRRAARDQPGEAGDQQHQGSCRRREATRSTCACRSASVPELSMTTVACFAFSLAGSCAAMRARASASSIRSRRRSRSTCAATGAVTRIKPSSPSWRPFSTINAASYTATFSP